MTDFFSKIRALSQGVYPSGRTRSNGNGASNSTSNGFHQSFGITGETEPAASNPSARSNGGQPGDRSQLTNGSPQPATEPPAKPPLRQWKPLYRQRWAWAVLGAVAAIGGTATSAYVLVQEIEGELPDTAEVLTYARDGTLTIRAADGTILQQIGPQTRQKLTIDKIPQQLIQAFVASEDKNFYQHTGVDYLAIVRAVRSNLLAGEVVEGASTITQQVARIVFLDQDRSLERKLREALLANKIERNLEKPQILERYLNLVYLGSGAYGVADAAWIYFGKSVDKLTLSEMAMIAGLPPAPTVYSPLVDEEAAQVRREVVLRRMLEAEYITSAQMESALAEPLALKPSQPHNFVSPIPYFTSHVQQQLTTLVEPEVLEAGGLTIETTVNLEWQKLAEETVRNAISNYGPGQNFSQAALVAINPRNGEIRAMAGGNDFAKSQFNRVTQAQRQPGSTFKAFVYTAAIAAGFSPYKSYNDVKFHVDGYEPQNVTDNYRGMVSIRDALIASINTVAVKTLIDVGFKPAVDMANRMGIKSQLIPAYSLALGTSEVNLLELTSAYGTLANNGNHVEVHSIRRITNRYGEVVYEFEPVAKRVVDETTTAIMTWMLRGAVEEGTGGNARLRDRPVAGKTGTSEEKRDLWFVGYIPQMVVGVWLGNDDNKPTWGASSTAARVWHNFSQEVIDEIPVEQFPELPRLRGRKGSIQAQPVKPRRMRDIGKPGSNQGEESGSQRRRSTSAERSEPSRESRQPADEPAAPRRNTRRNNPVAPSPLDPPEPPPLPPAPEPAPEPPRRAADPPPRPVAPPPSAPEPPAPAPAAPPPAPAPEAPAG